MRVVVPIVVLGLGCGRFGFETVFSIDAADGSLDALADGTIAADGGEFNIVEAISVPVDGSTAMSSTILSSTGAYRLRASGQFFTGGVGDQMGDAEYHDFSAPDDNSSATGEDFGISIDRPVVGTKITRWGPYTTTHVYEIEFAGQDLPIGITFHDGVYTSNSGSLSLAILAR